MIELTERLADAERYADGDMDPREQAHCRQMIFTWRNGGKWPNFSVQTLPMRQVARILRGEATYPAGSLPGALSPAERS